MASKTVLNCESYFFSSSASLRARSACVASTRRNRTKARTTIMLTWMARGELTTLAAMIAPCSVKTKGRVLRPTRPRVVFEVANCDLKTAASAWVSRNMKSFGNRSALRLTASFKRLVVVPHKSARSRSMRTFSPRTWRIDRSILTVGSAARPRWDSGRAAWIELQLSRGIVCVLGLRSHSCDSKPMSRVAKKNR
jgi:hypothetical protein